MSHTAKIEIQDPEGKSGIYPCPSCRRETSQAILSIVKSHEDGLVQFWDHYLTVRCNGCGTVSFCHVSKCSEEEEFDHQGRLSLIEHKRSYPDVDPRAGDLREGFVEASTLDSLASFPKTWLDTTKLVQLLVELNRAYEGHSYLSCIFLIRGVLDHVPPIFGLSSFAEVASNYAGGGRSFREAMHHLQNASRKIADNYLHLQIRQHETIPTKSQVEFRADVALLLSEIVRALRGQP
jgi:hypothetical protein